MGPLVSSPGLAWVEQGIEPRFSFTQKNAPFPFSNEEPS